MGRKEQVQLSAETTITVAAYPNCNVNNSITVNLLRSRTVTYDVGMKNDARNTVVDLLPAQVLRIFADPGTTVTCEAGTLWVTQHGVARDDFLRAGESLRIEGAGLALAEAVGSAAARCTLNVPISAHARRFLRSLAPC